jgi:hypothetical protein
MTYACSDNRGEGRIAVQLLLRGDGSYMPTTGQFLELRNFGEHLTYRMPDGSERESRNHVVYVAGIALGHKEMSNVIRYKLDEGD